MEPDVTWHANHNSGIEEKEDFDMKTATFANRKLRLATVVLAALLYILRRKRHRSIQRKKLYLRMSNV